MLPTRLPVMNDCIEIGTYGDLAGKYTGYLRFNGAPVNYDRAGRNASSNYTVYLLARFVF